MKSIVGKRLLCLHIPHPDRVPSGDFSPQDFAGQTARSLSRCAYAGWFAEVGPTVFFSGEEPMADPFRATRANTAQAISA
ncbi:MAG: hypothetical protein AB1Z20_20020, partial [Desulfobacterales bacterium]